MKVRQGFTLAIVLLLSALCFSVTAVASTTDQDRLEKLESVLHNKKDKVLSLSLDTFRKYIEVAPRSYSMIVLFTADPSICQPCAAMRRNFAQVVLEYYNLSPKQRASYPVYFAELKLSISQAKFLNDYSIQHVPILYHFARGSRNQYPTALVPGADSLNIEEMGSGMNAMKSFINSRLKSKLAVRRTDYKIPFVPYMRTFLPVIIAVAIVIFGVAFFMGWTQKALFWFIGCMIVYMYSVGGGHFSWIHDVPFAVVNSEGGLDIVAGGSRSQYAAEGLVVGVLCSLISILIIVINELPHIMPHKGAQTSAGLVLVFSTFALVRALLSLHDIKMPGYLLYNE